MTRRAFLSSRVIQAQGKLSGAKHPSWGSKLELRGVVGNRYKKTRFLGILTCVLCCASFSIAIFEFFRKNAADWWWKCFEIRLFDVENVASKFAMLTCCSVLMCQRIPSLQHLFLLLFTLYPVCIFEMFLSLHVFSSPEPAPFGFVIV